MNKQQPGTWLIDENLHKNYDIIIFEYADLLVIKTLNVWNENTTRKHSFIKSFNIVKTLILFIL